MVNRRASLVTMVMGGWVLLITGCELSSPAGGLAESTAAPSQEIASSGSSSELLVNAEPSIRSPSTINSVQFVRATADRLQLKVDNYPLESLLDEIARQSGVVIVRNEPLVDGRISLELQDLSLEEGLRRLLKQQDLFFFFTPAKKADGTIAEGATPLLKGVWIYPQGQGDQLVPVPPETWASSTEIEQGLRHSDPKERARSVELLIARKGEHSLSEVHLALNDQEENVRERALRAALSAALPLPTAWLEALAQYDLSPTMRVLALGAVASGSAESVVANPNIKMIAELALNDLNPAVQEQAREVLDQLEQLQQVESNAQSSPHPWQLSGTANNSASSPESTEDVQQNSETP